ncbi:MAG: hypothetical protein J0M26_11085 [Planctomycetes bacterium]|nr:hypothetical protein [Planctomycetota bacterium]
MAAFRRLTVRGKAAGAIVSYFLLEHLRNLYELFIYEVFLEQAIYLSTCLMG